jgi:hypothetical protein
VPIDALPLGLYSDSKDPSHWMIVYQLLPSWRGLRVFDAHLQPHHEGLRVEERIGIPTFSWLLALPGAQLSDGESAWFVHGRRARSALSVSTSLGELRETVQFPLAVPVYSALQAGSNVFWIGGVGTIFRGTSSSSGAWNWRNLELSESVWKGVLVTALWCDRPTNLWIGTSTNGIAVYDLQRGEVARWLTVRTPSVDRLFTPLVVPVPLD